MKGKILKNLSANTLQLVVNQVFGLLIFFVLSTGLDKKGFGELNLALAVLLSSFNILSFGIEPIAVKKIASGEDAPSLLSVYLFHVILAGILFYMVLIILSCSLPQISAICRLLLFIGVGKLMIFISSPFKQFAAGLEQFKLLSGMSVVSNLIRGIALAALSLLHTLTLNHVIVVFVAADTAELLVSFLLFNHQLNIPVRIRWNREQYFRLIKEAVPQIGVVVFTSALARFDWVFIGFILSAAKLAEYSFAYKVFEMATLPLLALAPLLVPRFTRIFKTGTYRVSDMVLLFRMEMIIAALISLLLCLSWVPVMDLVTNNKYGLVNSKTILILSCCMPLLYFNNFLWSVSFARGRLTMIFRVIAVAFTINLAGDVLLIPYLKNEGAALAYFAAMLVEGLIMIKKNDVAGLGQIWKPLIICTLCALLSGFIAVSIFLNPWLICTSAVAFYIIALLFTRQLKLTDRYNITQMLR